MERFSPGDILDDYRIAALLSAGNMASVYRAVDLRTGNTVALKVPDRNANGSAGYLERFRLEARIGREMDHPGIVRVLPERGGEFLYIAMEWAEGESLRTILQREGRLPVARATRIATGVCDALTYVHSRGFVHRDLKPENIVVGGGDSVRIIDFGVAGREGAGKITFTKFAAGVMGTPDYISPEQVKGKYGDARSDVYALGVVLYEMVAGRPPFDGDNPFAVMNARLAEEAPPLSEEVPDISPQVEEIVRRALERDPNKRYRSAAEFSFDLEKPDAVRMRRRRFRRGEAPSIGKRIMAWSTLAAIPALVLGLLLYAASHQ